MNENGYDNNPFENDENDYLFKIVTNNGRRKTYGWSVASMVSGILSVICCCTGWTGLFFGIISIIFAIISRKNLGYFDGMAVSGLVLGIIGLVLGVALIVFAYTIDEEYLEKLLEEYMAEFESEYPSDIPSEPET